MLKLAASLIFSAVLITSAKPMFEQKSIVDSHGKLILMQGEESAAMTGQCKSYKVTKNPPLVPRLKCRFS
jgi:hypothetical protein